MELDSDKPSPRGALVLAAVLGGLFATVSSALIVATALPTIAADLGIEPGVSVLLIVASLLAMAVAIPAWGILADRRGFAVVALASLAFFLAGSWAAGFAPSFEALLVFRLAQGVGTGGFMVASQALARLLSPPGRHARTAGIVGAVMSIASLCGPLIGGAVVDAPGWGWRWSFAILSPLALAAFVVLAITLPRGLSAPRRAPVRVRLGASPIYRWALVGSVGLGAVMYTSIVFLSTYLQLGAGRSASLAGVMSLPLLAATFVCSIVAGRLVARAGMGRVLIIGTLVLTAGLAVVALGAGVGREELAVAGSVLIGVGIGATMQNFVVVAQASAPPEALGRATSIVSLIRTLTGAVAMTGLGGVLTAVARAGDPTDYGRASAVVFGLLGVSAIGALVAALAIARRHTEIGDV